MINVSTTQLPATTAAGENTAHVSATNQAPGITPVAPVQSSIEVNTASPVPTSQPTISDSTVSVPGIPRTSHISGSHPPVPASAITSSAPPAITTTSPAPQNRPAVPRIRAATNQSKRASSTATGTRNRSGPDAGGSAELSQPPPAIRSNDEARPAQQSASREKAGSGSCRPTKRKKVTTNRSEDVRSSVGGEEEVEGEDDDEDETSQPKKSAPQRRRKPRDPNAPKKNKRRASTPEDAEEQVVDPANTKMADLTKDLRIGKKFAMRDAILQRELEKKEKARVAKEKGKDKELTDAEVTDAEGERGQTAANTESENGDQALPEAAANNVVNATVPVSFSSAPITRVVNGRLVLDEASTQVDRQRQAAEDAAAMEVVEQDDFTRIVTAGTNMKREKSVRWGHFETEKFYEGLTMFGTDFEMIAKTFGNKRTRRQVKLKFNKEERENPDRVKRCMTGKKQEAMDLNKVKGSSKLEDTDVIMAEIALKEKGFDDEEKRRAAADAEVDRLKRAAIRAGGVAAGGESLKENETGTSGNGSAAHASKPKKKAPAKKNKRAMNQHMGGEEAEIVGTI